MIDESIIPGNLRSRRLLLRHLWVGQDPRRSRRTTSALTSFGTSEVVHRAPYRRAAECRAVAFAREHTQPSRASHGLARRVPRSCLLYTSDAADERSSVDLG